ncbi:hypothetical protein ACOSQ2_021119 [Xanthoceras sorbifolium]
MKVKRLEEEREEREGRRKSRERETKASAEIVARKFSAAISLRRWVYGQAWGFWVGEERETEQETEAVSAKSGLFSQTLDDPRTTTKREQEAENSGDFTTIFGGKKLVFVLDFGCLKVAKKRPKSSLAEDRASQP